MTTQQGKNCRATLQKMVGRRTHDTSTKRVRRAPPEAYKEKSKILKKMMERKTKESWSKFLMKSGHRQPTPGTTHILSPTKFHAAGQDTPEGVCEALTCTKNNSSPGRDHITYCLLKLSRDTHLGQSLIHEKAGGFKGDVHIAQA